MKKQDARTLLPATQEHLRRQAIWLKKNGKKYVEIAEIVGFHRNTVSKWWKVYERDGAKGLKAKPSPAGLPPATGCFLSRRIFLNKQCLFIATVRKPRVLHEDEWQPVA